MRKITQNEFLEKANKAKDENLIIIGGYTNATTKVEVKCALCGKEWGMLPNNIYRGKGCKCQVGFKNSQKQRLTQDEFFVRASKILGNEYEILGEYQGWDEHVALVHKTCGHKWSPSAGSILNGRKCPICRYTTVAEKRRSTRERISKMISECGDGSYELIGDYKDRREKVCIKHNVCGHKFFMTPNHFLEGSRCTYCFSSKGEKEVADFLSNNNLQYITQKCFDGCFYKNHLRFDFYVPKLNICIEYDGQQHFREVSLYGDKEGLKGIQARDNIKNKFCENNGIQLIRIRYDESVSDILKTKLKMENNNEIKY